MFVYTMPLTCDAITQEELDLLETLSPERVEKFHKQKTNMGKRQCLYGPVLVRKGISELLHMDPSEITFEIGKLGKPYAKNLPGVSFNVSHTKGMLLCAVSIEGNIGVDVELVRKAPSSVMKRAFHEEEKAYVEEASDKEELYNRRFFQIWTQKEAYTKYLGTGISSKLSEINTLSSELAPHYRIWEENGFIFTVYTEDMPS